MKKLSIFVAALVLTLGLAQCKKEQTNNAQGEGNFVRITLNVGGNGNGSRVNVDPAAAEQVTFTNGDQILVASNGAVVGTLTHNGTNFSGDITDATEGQRLYFYFLGNKQGTVANGATNCTVNISDQTNGLPVISMGASTVDYSEGVTSYSSRLYNKCSLMKFVVDTPSEAAICITGMNNTVTVDFSDPTDTGFTYGKDGDGLITMPGVTAENTTTWAIVLPQVALEVGEEGSAYTADEAYTGTRPAMEAIEMNKFLNEGVNLTVNTTVVSYTVLSAATAADCGKVVCAAGHLHDAKTAVPTGCTAVGILGKVTETGHGLILALQDATPQYWPTINGWESVTDYASTTLQVLPDDAARGSLTSYTTLGATTVSNWAVAQKSDYEAIFINLGSTTGNSKGKTYDSNVNAYITTGVGGTALSGRYWSATVCGCHGVTALQGWGCRAVVSRQPCLVEVPAGVLP
ncbi:MAG: hypothetical protein IJP44_12015 [Bacteroidales bacterium]|nr:hypothetical protein [Bacteroidales bacterium]